MLYRYMFLFITIPDVKFKQKLSVSESVNRQLAVTFVFIGLQDLSIHRYKKNLLKKINIYLFFKRLILGIFSKQLSE